MIFVVYAAENDDSIKTSLGVSDYSYYFVLKSYVPVLNKIGTVFILDNLEEQAETLGRLYQDCISSGEPLVLLSFTPPHFTETNQPWPSLAVFAWEYSSIPMGGWGGNSRNDWRTVLAEQGLAITHSEFAVSSVREAMGNGFPIVSVPAPIWDNFDSLYQPKQPGEAKTRSKLCYEGCLLDSWSLDLGDLSPQNKAEKIPELVKQYATPAQQELSLEGIVYTAVLNPIDVRKNWPDLLRAYCWAFREQDDVTLVIKATYFNVELVLDQFLWEMYQWQPFKCRILIIHGYLDDEVFNHLIKASDFAVNAAHGEGQCLPLMEFMSAGIPAIAPDHSAMADYITPENAFVVKSSPEWIHLPHAPDLAFRTFRYRIDWESLRDAYRSSYELAKNSPAGYQAMSKNANRQLKEHCSRGVAERKLDEFFQKTLPVFWQPGLRGLLGKLRRRVLGGQNLAGKYASQLKLYTGDDSAS